MPPSSTRREAPPAPKTRDPEPKDAFVSRHVGPSSEDVAEMLRSLGLRSLEELVDQTVPQDIRLRRPLDLPEPRSERDLLQDLRALASKNRVWRSFLGLGYHGTFTPTVIQRNVLENPGWYTQYTPYQSEISQGRLEALLTWQTTVSDLAGMEIANASLLDEGTAAAEAMHLCFAVRGDARTFLVARDCHPQTIALVRTRARPHGIRVVVEDPSEMTFDAKVAGCLLQYPATDGAVRDPRPVVERARAAGALVVVATDLLALCVLESPGALGADVVVGNSQRFGVPMGFGGPHAAFLATKDAYKRQMPGRLVGVSKDAAGNPALRLALGTREQHIRRERATSNICTAQVLLAVMAAFYAVWHGPEGLRRIARRVHGLARVLAEGLGRLGVATGDAPFFDTVRADVGPEARRRVLRAAAKRRINLRAYGKGSVCVALDQVTSLADVGDVLACFAEGGSLPFAPEELRVADDVDPAFARKGEILSHPVFRAYRSETEFLRYVRGLEAKDLSLTTSMIPLGSCTMKLNATSEMLPITWPELADVHPFAPSAQTAGYRELFERLERALCEITGFAACSLQPNAGSQGEYAGLLVIREHHARRGEGRRDVCLIPQSAHGTNPASAVMAGMRVVVVACDDRGNVDLEDLRAKARENRDALAALMITYPSTHGVFEPAIREICEVVHEAGGQVYMDGANMNAQVGLCRPGDFGPDVCHLNLHKTFCIPHGGGGPGMGPICVAAHLAPYLPGHPLAKVGGAKAIGPVSAAPWGSAGILPIPYAYVALMGASGLAHATRVAILSANYMAERLEPHFPVLYRGATGRVAHEFILDLRPAKEASGVEVEDVAKRLQDYGFHAPTVSFPVAGTLMVEPTESEPKSELDRFCDAMIAIKGEIDAIAAGRMDRLDNPLKNAPHTAAAVTATEWAHAYPREQAAFPAPWTRRSKFWPAVARVDNVYGDRNLVCSCPPVAEYLPA